METPDLQYIIDCIDNMAMGYENDPGLLAYAAIAKKAITDLVTAKETMIDQFFEYLRESYDIETREELEAQAKNWNPPNPLLVALHYIWKRDPKVATKDAEIAEMTDLAVFLCATWKAIDEWAWKNAGGTAMMSYPVIQGIGNQIKLGRISKLPCNSKNIAKAADAVLSRAALKEVE